jgi:hypothetical protein
VGTTGGVAVVDLASKRELARLPSRGLELVRHVGTLVVR